MLVSSSANVPIAAPSRTKLRTLTTLRFLAALHVVLFHMRVVGILAGGPWWYQNFASIGYIGVNCFFVLSGFILVYTYAGSSLSSWRFWQARFARIYPAYVLSLLAAAPFFFFAVRNLDLPFFTWSKQHLVTACLLRVGLLQSWVPNAALTWNSVCWSLSVEAFFYVLFPLVMLWSQDVKPRNLLLWIAGSSLVSLSLSLLYLVLHPDGISKINSGETTLLWKNVLSFNPLARLPEFMVGVFAGRLFLARSNNGSDNPRNNQTLATPLILGGLVVVATITVLVGEIPNPLISAGFLSPAFAATIYGLALQPKWASFLETGGWFCSVTPATACTCCIRSSSPELLMRSRPCRGGFVFAARWERPSGLRCFPTGWSKIRPAGFFAHTTRDDEVLSRGSLRTVSALVFRLSVTPSCPVV